MSIDGDVGLWQENAGAVFSAREYRRLLDRMMMGWDVRTSGGSATSGTANGGVSRSGDLAVSQRGAGANMSVDVALGGGIVGVTESAHGGDVYAYSDATINVAITASDPTNPRIDIVGVRVRDSEYSGATDDTQVVVVTGTAAGVPAEPTLPANFLTLARVDVAAAAASILTANITDRRRRLAALGGIIVCTSTTRPTVGLWEGMHIFETDTDRVLVYDGAAWQRSSYISSTGRTGGVWTRATNLSIANATQSDITFTTESVDSDGYLAPTSATATIPAGLGGLYAWEVFYAWSASPGAGGFFALLNGSQVYSPSPSVGATNAMGFSGVLLMAAAETLKFQVVQNSGGPINVTSATFVLQRLGI